MSVCSIKGCGKPRYRKNQWCIAHYERWRKHGDPHAGRPSYGYIEKYFRETVLRYDGDDCLLWPYAKDGNGYATFQQRPAHRSVCEHVHGPAPTPEHQAAHSCGNGHLACVTKRHLSWKTRAENEADKLVHGTSNRGERNGNAQITADIAREILALKDVLPRREIAAQLNVSRQTVRNVVSGRRWGWLTQSAACLFLFIVPVPSPAHDATPTAAQPQGWSYSISCCSGFDCRRVELPAKVAERPDGYVVPSGEVIAMSDPRIKPSPDGEFHWCTVGGKNDSRTICLYAPARGM